VGAAAVAKFKFLLPNVRICGVDKFISIIFINSLD